MRWILRSEGAFERLNRADVRFRDTPFYKYPSTKAIQFHAAPRI